jgi:hypothetical protein
MAIPWNIDWEQYAHSLAGSGIPFTNIINEPEIIRPFVEAINERISVCKWTFLGGNIRYQNHQISIPQSGYTALRNADTGPIGLAWWANDTSFFDSPPQSSVDPNPLPVASGISWAELQHLVVDLSQNFIQDSNNLTAEIWEKTQGNSDSARTDPHARSVLDNTPLEKSWIYSWTPFTTNLYGLSSNGSFPDQTNLHYYQDTFPKPSGFRRMFPREIWELRNHGQDGQTARFVALKGSGVSLEYKWFGTTREDHEYYGQTAFTPQVNDNLSGSILRYTAASGWVKSEDQLTSPDFISTSGCVESGDYIGGWYLNDLRDAINSMTKTFGIWAWERDGGRGQDFGGGNYFGWPFWNIGSINETFWLRTEGFYKSYPPLSDNFDYESFNNMTHQERLAYLESIRESTYNSSTKYFGGQAYAYAISTPIYDSEDGGYYRSVARGYVNIYPSGHENINLNREYTFYAMAVSWGMPNIAYYPHDVYYDQAPFDTFDMNGDKGQATFTTLYPDDFTSRFPETPFWASDEYIATSTAVSLGKSATGPVIHGNPELPMPTLASIPSGPSGPSVTHTVGYRTREYFAICDWEVDGGFKYTKSKSD